MTAPAAQKRSLVVVSYFKKVLMLYIVKKILRLFDVHDAIYDDAYYAKDVAGPAEQAAPHVAASIAAHFQPKRLIDVGCGTGAMLDAARTLGIDVMGARICQCGDQDLQSARAARASIQHRTG